jgi:hypothetical protein
MLNLQGDGPVPLRGVLSVPFRAFGIRPSRMNPNTCTICELMFATVMRARKVTTDATVLFADLRGNTTLSQSLSPDAVRYRGFAEPARRLQERQFYKNLAIVGGAFFLFICAAGRFSLDAILMKKRVGALRLQRSRVRNRKISAPARGTCHPIKTGGDRQR